MGLRAEIEEDLEDFLEGDDYGQAVVLISPGGVRYSKSANDPTADLMGQVLYDSISQTEDGVEVIDHNPVVTLRRSSLAKIPAPNEKWGVNIPTGPRADATRETFIMERASEDGGSIGFIRLYLRKAEQVAP